MYKSHVYNEVVSVTAKKYKGTMMNKKDNKNQENQPKQNGSSRSMQAIITRECIYCNHIRNDSDIECIESDYCEENPGYGNLKSFPFKKEMKCFEERLIPSDLSV